VAVSLAMFAAILVLRWAVAGADDLLSVLFVLPVALLALSSGVRAGLADGAAAVQRMERRAAELALLQREAAEITDSVLQMMAATKWMLESGRVAGGIELLEESMNTAQRLVSRMLGPDAVRSGGLVHSRRRGEGAGTGAPVSGRG